MQLQLRNSAKALIQQGDLVLVTENYDDVHGFVYVLPGGGAEPGELLTEALRREVKEETGAEISVGGLRFVREFIPTNHEFFSEWVQNYHQVDFIFRCEIPEHYDPTQAPPGDIPWQRSVRWMSIAELRELRFYPKRLLDFLVEPEYRSAPVYLGDVT